MMMEKLEHVKNVKIIQIKHNAFKMDYQMLEQMTVLTNALVMLMILMIIRTHMLI
jgi:hypothetical protein